MAAAEVLGMLTSQKEPFSHSDMSTIYSKSQWKFKITIELTCMDNIKTWKNTAKRMIDFLPVTWKCCFYSAHFQPGGMFFQVEPCWILMMSDAGPWNWRPRSSRRTLAVPIGRDGDCAWPIWKLAHLQHMDVSNPYNPRVPPVIKLSSIFAWDFPWNKPSSYWGIPMT